MEINFYTSGNYIIHLKRLEPLGDPVMKEFAKGYTTYTYNQTNETFTIRESVGGTVTVTKAEIESGIVKDETNAAYDFTTFVTFLRENTGFKTAPGGSGAVVSTGSPVVTTNIWVGTQAQYDALTPDSATLYFIQ